MQEMETREEKDIRAYGAIPISERTEKENRMMCVKKCPEGVRGGLLTLCHFKGSHVRKDRRFNHITFKIYT